MGRSTTNNVLLGVACGVCLLSLFPCPVNAFGSGNIPDAAYLKGKAWRHGEIEDSLEKLAKVAGSGGGALIGAIAGALFSGGGGDGQNQNRGPKFKGLDVSRVYFGNWLRDLSQVCDIAGFKAMTSDSLVIVVMVLGFLSFGYATGEFEVTRERLAVYLLTEHIDNPKGYGEGEDARQYDSRLRPPIDDRELEVDESNGMKRYIASDNESFDTSTKCIRRTLQRCIELGREAQREGNKEKEYESLRLLGTGLHTLEDFPAHSNWCELALQKLGNTDVFAHVGDNVKVNSPSGPVPPLVTGTFGGADFMHSMLGEVGDKISQSSITDLTAQLDAAQQSQSSAGGAAEKINMIKNIISMLPKKDGEDDVGDKLGEMEQKKEGFNLDGKIDSIAPEDVQKQIWAIFKIRDDIMRRITETIEGVPGLSELIENLSTSLSEFVMVNIDPFVRPILLQAASAIGEGSKAVISGEDQWTVFDDPNASDPTHSVLAKDHFANLLNEPAGNVAVIIVKHSVEAIVRAWSNDDDPNQVIDGIIEAIHHPAYANGDSAVQREMIEYMERWLQDMDDDDRQKSLNALTKDGVRNHRNQRKTSAEGEDPRLVGGADLHSHGSSSTPQGRYGNSGAGYPTSGGGQYQSPHVGGTQGGNQVTGGYQPSYGSHQGNDQNRYRNFEGGGISGGYGRSETSGYVTRPSGGYGSGGASGGYNTGYQDTQGRRNEEDRDDRFGRDRREGQEPSGYGAGYADTRTNEYESGRPRQEDYEAGRGRHRGDDEGFSSYNRRQEAGEGYQGYGRGEDQQPSGYRQRQEEPTHGYSEDYGSRQQESYGGGYEGGGLGNTRYGAGREEPYGGSGSFGRHGDDEQPQRRYGGGGDFNREVEGGYGSNRGAYGGGGYGRDNEGSFGGGGRHGGDDYGIGSLNVREQEELQEPQYGRQTEDRGDNYGRGW